MHIVPENQMAYDATALGFPSILGCQAICLQTSRGLYGFHDLKTSEKTLNIGGSLTAQQAGDAKLTEFANWVNGKLRQNETVTALYGVINRGEQYIPSPSGNADWKSVLLGLANALNFNGPVYGARINSHVEKKGAERSVYVQFDQAGGVVSVGYKRWSKMGVDDSSKAKPGNQKRVVWRKNAFATEALFGQGLVAPVIRTDGKTDFNLNRIAVKKYHEFQ